MDYSFTEKENLSAETEKMVDSVIRGWRRLREEYCEKYVKDILWCAEEYESNKWHEPFEALPEKLKNEILVQKGRK